MSLVKLQFLSTQSVMCDTFGIHINLNTYFACQLSHKSLWNTVFSVTFAGLYICKSVTARWESIQVSVFTDNAGYPLCVRQCVWVSGTVNECVTCKVSGLGRIEAAEWDMNNGSWCCWAAAVKATGVSVGSFWGFPGILHSFKSPKWVLLHHFYLPLLNLVTKKNSILPFLNGSQITSQPSYPIRSWFPHWWLILTPLSLQWYIIVGKASVVTFLSHSLATVCLPSLDQH